MLLGKPPGMPRGCSEEPLGLFLPSPPAPSGPNRGGEAGTGGPQQGTPTRIETLWKEPPGASRAFWTFRSAGKKPPKMILMQVCGCNVHPVTAYSITVTGQGHGYRAVDWFLHQLPECPVCLAGHCPRELAAPQEMDRATPHQWEGKLFYTLPRRHIAA